MSRSSWRGTNDSSAPVDAVGNVKREEAGIILRILRAPRTLSLNSIFTGKSSNVTTGFQTLPRVYENFFIKLEGLKGSRFHE
jgi:hypothetical protein